MKKGVLLILLLIATVAQVSAYEFCDDGIIGEDKLRIISVDDMLKENSQEWNWEPLQNIELEIRVENKDDKTRDYILKAIFIENGDKVRIADDREDLEIEIQLTAGQRESISLNFQVDEDMEEGDFELYIKFYERGDEDEECTENGEETVIIERVELCEDGNVDRDDLEITKIIDEEYDNDEAWDWTPGEEVEISVEISNKEYSERDFTVELVMLDENKNEIDFSDDQSRIEYEVEIDEGDTETVELIFRLNPIMQEGDYSLYAKVYDTEDDDICTILKAEERSSPRIIEVTRIENSVIVAEITGPKEIETTGKVNYTAKIINMGSEDEEKVSIIMYNRILGIMKTIEIENLESGQETEVTFDFELPSNATAGRYTILFTTEFDYDDKKEAYRKFAKDNDEIKYNIQATDGDVEAQTKEDTTGNETIENETIINETIIEDFTEENEPNNIMAPITGNVVGSSGQTSIWPITIGFLLLAVVGVFLFFKKPKAKKEIEFVEHPNITRRYTARLD